MIRQKTTPKHIFKIPFQTSDLTAVELVYRQDQRILLTLREGDLAMDGDTITAELTQEQTLRFSDRRPVEVQMAVLDSDGHAFTSRKVRIDVYEAISKDILP